MKVLDYEAVTADKINRLNDLVSDLLLQGYQPLGGIAVTMAFSTLNTPNRVFTQAMVKYEDKASTKATVK